jgi:hypothetical protein
MLIRALDYTETFTRGKDRHPAADWRRLKLSLVTNPRLPTLIIMQYRMVGRAPARMSRSIHQKSTAALCCIALASASTAALHATSDSPQAAQPAVLVELFTSEGCSSCPPADRFLAELDHKQPVPGLMIVVLSEHVDYWNQLGWRDPFSSHQWSERQDEYGRQFGLDSVYTPQIIVDGNIQVSGNDSPAVLTAIERSVQQTHIDIAVSKLERSANSLQLEITAGPAPGAVLYAVIADDADHSSVERGENAGRTLEHVAVARSLVKVAALENALLEKKIAVALPPGAANRHLRIIVFARDGSNGHILGVTAREL